MVGQTPSVLRWLRTLVRTGADAQQPDDELVQRFVTSSDEKAFSLLVQKHGPIVWGVCRRVLSEFADVEDAFQATFLVFAQKAASIRKRTSVGCWLYGVANRIARRLRDKNKRQRRCEIVPITNGEGAEFEAAKRELCAVIDDTLAALPEQFRLPLLLCYIHGKSQDEAAAELGWSKPTLRGRLERGRALMQERLARRGITLPAALLASVLTDQAFASVPASLTLHIGAAAMEIASGKSAPGYVSARVLALTNGDTKAMLMEKCLRAIAIASVAAFITAGLGVLYGFAFPESVDENPNEPLVAANQKQEDLDVREKLDVFLRGTMGKYTIAPKDVQRGDFDLAFSVENVFGKDIPKGTKIYVLRHQDAAQYQFVAKALKKIDLKGEEQRLWFRSLFVIENNQIAKIKKEGDTWWIEPKAIVILKHGHAGDLIRTLDAESMKIEAGDDELRRLIKQRQHSTIRELEGLQKQINEGHISHSAVVLEAAKRYVDSTLELTENSNGRIAICRRYLEFTENIEWIIGGRLLIGGGVESPTTNEKAVQARIDAEILLLKELRRAK